MLKPKEVLEIEQLKAAREVLCAYMQCSDRDVIYNRPKEAVEAASTLLTKQFESSAFQK